VVTGKIGPIVLIFGVYVMVYGHLSPGGGFQGGVIIASGIIFLALGSGLDTSAVFADATALNRLEAGALLVLVLASLSGITVGKGFFGNPLEIFTEIPAAFIILLNALIGLKVGAGIGLLCISMLGEEL
jgi:multicomponent Na+:H+ antiporter subunit B